VHLASVLTIAPNPFFSFIKIVAGEPARTYNVTVYSAAGHQLMHKRFSGTVTLNTAALASGTYIIKVESGSSVQTFKLQKQYY
jgi:hypothetical protein